MGSNRRHSVDGGSRPSPPDPKRARYDPPEPVCIDLVSDGDDGPPIPGEVDLDRCPSPPAAASDAATHPPGDAETPEAKVNRLMAEYSRDLKPTNSGKKAKYYVVWHGRQDGIFTNWDECNKHVKGFPKAGFKGEKTLESAKSLLRENLLARFREEAREEALEKAHEEQRSRLPPQYPSAAPSSATPGFAADQPPLEDYEPVPLPEEPVLCQEQQDAMDLAMQGHNLFITGSGGCGKSVLVKALHTKFIAMRERVHLIVPTGLSALNIGGQTTFNYAGWTPDDFRRPFERLIRKSQGKRIFKRLQRTDVLIIDEISMVENQFFERLSRVVSSVRAKVGGAFGGVQVIAVGDFCQLPPVKPFERCAVCGKEMSDSTAVAYSCPDGHGDFEDHEKWAFNSPEWERCQFKYVQLTQIHRQQDEQFVRVLQKCRLGEELDNSDVRLLLRHPTQAENGARLFSYRWKVDDYNDLKFRQLPGDELVYPSWDDFSFPDDPGYEHEEDPVARANREKARLSEHRYSGLLRLKLNMPVILLANIDLESELCNGSQGTICGFAPIPPQYRPKGPQLDKYKKDPIGYFVARKRYELAKRFIHSEDTPCLFPKVQFADGRRRVIGPDCSTNEVGEKAPYCLLSRTQIPLAPGWSMTIHKSQSLSLDRVIVNLGDVFVKGQAYVALSRARSLRGLKIEGTSEARLRSAIKLDPDVKEFMDRLNALKAGPALVGAPAQSSDVCRKTEILDVGLSVRETV